MSNGLIKINGKTYTIGRAISLGLITIAAPSVAPIVPVAPTRREKAAALKAARNADARKDIAVGQLTFDPIIEPTDLDDGVEDGDKPLPAPKKTKVLLPRNVDHDGVPIEDPEVLDKIAATTVEIEAARAAAEADDDG